MVGAPSASCDTDIDSKSVVFVDLGGNELGTFPTIEVILEEKSREVCTRNTTHAEAGSVVQGHNSKHDGEAGIGKEQEPRQRQKSCLALDLDELESSLDLDYGEYRFWKDGRSAGDQSPMNEEFSDTDEDTEALLELAGHFVSPEGIMELGDYRRGILQDADHEYYSGRALFLLPRCVSAHAIGGKMCITLVIQANVIELNRKALVKKLKLERPQGFCSKLLPFIEDENRRVKEAWRSRRESPSAWSEEGLANYFLNQNGVQWPPPKSFPIRPRFLADKEVCRDLLKKKGCESLLRFMPDEIRDDAELVKLALGSDWHASNHAVLYASERLRCNKEFLLWFVSCSRGYLLKPDPDPVSCQTDRRGEDPRADRNKRYESIFRDRDNRSMKSSPHGALTALEFVSSKFRNDKDIALAAVKAEGASLQFVAEDLKGDEDIVFAAIEKDWSAFKYASESLRGEKKIALFACARAPTRLHEACIWKHTTGALRNSRCQLRKESGKSSGSKKDIIICGK